MNAANVMPSLTDLRAKVTALAEAAEVTPISMRPAIDPTADWYAAQTTPRSEIRAMHGVAALGMTAFVPFGWKWMQPRHAPSGTVVLRRRCAMPGYLFFIGQRDRRGDIRVGEVRDVDGVRDLVRQGLAPLRIRGSAIAKLHNAEARGVYDVNKEPPRGRLWDLQPGDQVRITVAPFVGWIEVVTRPLGNNRVEVLDDVFGQRLTVPLENCITLVT